MQQIVQFTTEYTVKEMTDFNHIANKLYPIVRVQRYRIFYYCVGVIGVGFSAYSFWQGSSSWFGILAYLIGMWYLIAAVFHYRLMGRKSFKNRPKGVEKMRFTFDKSGMVVENALGHSRYGFDDILKIAEGKTLFVFFTSAEQRQGFLVPKRDLEDVDGFRAMLEQQYLCGIEYFKI